MPTTCEEMAAAFASSIRYVGLCCEGVEIAGEKYDRMLVGMKHEGGGLIANTDRVDFPVAGGNWGKADGVMFFGSDGMQRGDVFPLESPAEIAWLDQMRFGPGEIAVRVSTEG